LLKVESERSRLECELKQTLIIVKNAEHNAQTCRKEQLENKQRVEILLREKNTIARSKETAYERIKRLNYELLLCGQGKKKIEYELDILTQTIDDMKKQMEVVEKERDRYNLVVQRLEKQVKYKTFTQSTRDKMNVRRNFRLIPEIIYKYLRKKFQKLKKRIYKGIHN